MSSADLTIVIEHAWFDYDEGGVTLRGWIWEAITPEHNHALPFIGRGDTPQEAVEAWVSSHRTFFGGESIITDLLDLKVV